MEEGKSLIPKSDKTPLEQALSSPNFAYYERLRELVTSYLPEKHIITQEHGILKVYAMTAGNISEHARQRWITEIASAYVRIISDLDSHFLVVDAAAIHL